MPVELATDATLTEWFDDYKRERMPDAMPATVNGWRHAVALFRSILKREPTGEDLTARSIDKLQRRLFQQAYSPSVVNRTLRVLTALWRYLSDIGAAVETAPRRRLDVKNRKYVSPRRTRIDFDSFEAIVGMKATPLAEVGAAEADREIVLPTISGPGPQDFQYAREVEKARAAARLELCQLCGTLLFGWSMLYQEWAGIDGKASESMAVRHSCGFADHLGARAELGGPCWPTTCFGAIFLTRFRKAIDGQATRHAQVVNKLRCVWRFAWEGRSVARGPAR